ncbi:MAG: hypothetical protein K5751_04010 [Treponemataceae bacterium]|nr:hypothetical protein [Treponemataceae bacterium]
MYVLLAFTLIIFNLVFLCDYIIERLIIKRLREMNGGIEHPLYSKDGISGNTRNAEFQEFLEDIEGEDDPELKCLKIYNKVVSRITRIAFIITFIIVAMAANK